MLAVEGAGVRVPGGGAEAVLRDMLFGEAGGQPGRPFVDALEFVERHLVPLSARQAAGLAYLEQLDRSRYGALVDAVLRFRGMVGSPEMVLRAIEAVALYDKFAGLSASVTRQKQVK